ncbi:MAG: amino acid ABC transporter substrate-binding protein [Hyphomicrobiales bacterium]|nr:MAG: amino acid ABC transporter substrate-binding protein [Hyphomicrobiales bacterium]
MKFRIGLAVSLGAIAAALTPAAHAADIIKLGMSVPMSGDAANWGKQTKWLCDRAAQEIKDSGGIKVGTTTYNFECLAYDNKYNAADGSKVAQTLINRDGVKFVALALGTAPARAFQSLSERAGVLLMTNAWGRSLKGTQFPLTFTVMNTPFELFGPLTAYIKEKNPNIKTVVLVNPNDASGQELEPESQKNWAKNGVKVLSSDWFERGTTEFQPIVGKLASLNPDVIDLGGTPPGVAGTILKELAIVGWKGIKLNGTGTSAEAILTTGGDAANGTYMGAAVSVDAKVATPAQVKLNADLLAATGEPVSGTTLGAYDAPFALKAAIEKAQSIDPKKVASAMPEITFPSFYGQSAFGGKATYDVAQQELIPVIVTQVQNGKLVELTRVVPEELAGRLKK